jgi:ribulose-phosphate 3-epimerase
MMPYILAPSIIASDFARLGEEIAVCESAGAGWLHLDVMDGHFVPQLTVGPLFLAACRRAARLPIDVHLMIEEPEKHLEAFARAGADRLTVHVEACRDLAQAVRRIKDLGCAAGITLNPSTPVAALESALPHADQVLVMSVVPGFSGQKFMPESVERVKSVRRRLDGLGSKAHLEVDGGITAETLPLVKAAGANVFVSGSAVFKHPQGTAQGILSLRQSMG